MGELHVPYYDDAGRLHQLDLLEGDWLKTDDGPVYVRKIDAKSMILVGQKRTGRSSQAHVVAMLMHGKWQKLERSGYGSEGTP